MSYYIARNPDVSAAEIALAHAAPYERLEDAWADMGTGVIFDQRGDIVAFHERHEWLLTRRESARMMNSATTHAYNPDCAYKGCPDCIAWEA